MICRDIPAEYICAPELLKLRAYDQEKHTELYDTLKMYIQCMLNAEQTARELYIHRSTLFYRLKKIREVSGLDLYKQENVFYIQFSINLLEKSKTFIIFLHGFFQKKVYDIKRREKIKICLAYRKNKGKKI